MVSDCCFNLYFTDDVMDVMWITISYMFAILVSSSVMCRSLLSLLIHTVFLCWTPGTLCILWLTVLNQTCHLRRSALMLQLACSFFRQCLFQREFLNFSDIQIHQFFLPWIRSLMFSFTLSKKKFDLLELVLIECFKYSQHPTNHFCVKWFCLFFQNHHFREDK